MTNKSVASGLSKMKVLPMLVLVVLFTAIFEGYLVNSLLYDHSASTECLAEPLRPQYGGGIIRNPEFSYSLEGWIPFGYGEIEVRSSKKGNRFAVARRRHQPHQSISQKIYLEKQKIYTFSAWLQLSEGNAPVGVIFKTAGDFIHAGVVETKSGCWSMLKGGLAVEESGPAELYFESNNSSVEIWADSVSLQPFTKDQWRAHQAQSIMKVRTQTLKLQFKDAHGNILPGASVSIQQTRPGFPLGVAVNKNILANAAYQNWFTSRKFTVTTFENEMKWYATEPTQGKEDYSAADSLLAFAKQHGVCVRGHNVFWDDPQYQQDWVKALPGGQPLGAAAARRASSVMMRYKGQVIAWDVVNENLHFSFFESKNGPQASAVFYRNASQLDPSTMLFLNDFNTLEHSGDGASTPSRYLEKLQSIQSYSGNRLKMAIGLEGHFSEPNLAYMRSALDTLASAKVPIWLTEVDVGEDHNQAKYFEEILREAFAHPAVQGIVVWGAWQPTGCYRMCLTDNNFKNLPTGDVLDKLMAEWRAGKAAGTTDADGFFTTQLFHGEYEMSVSHPSLKSLNSSLVQRLIVNDSASQHETVFQIRV